MPEVVPRYAVLGDAGAAKALQRRLQSEGLLTQVLSGPEGLEQVATLPDVDTVMAAIVGAAGLPATLAAARSGRRVLLANKEALVMAGRLFRDALRDSGGDAAAHRQRAQRHIPVSADRVRR